MSNYDFEYESIDDRLKILEEKYDCLLMDVQRLECENIELTNALYEFENRTLSEIDRRLPTTYNLQNFSLGDS